MGFLGYKFKCCDTLILTQKVWISLKTEDAESCGVFIVYGLIESNTVVFLKLEPRPNSVELNLFKLDLSLI